MYIFDIPGIKEGMFVKCLSVEADKTYLYTPNKVYKVRYDHRITGDNGRFVNGCSAEWEVVYLSDLSKEDVL